MSGCLHWAGLVGMVSRWKKTQSTVGGTTPQAGEVLSCGIVDKSS